MIFDILNEIARVGSTNQKLAILKSHADNELLQRVYRLTYHKQIQFGIKKIPAYDPHGSDFEKTFEETLDFLEMVLAKRQVTGNAAIGMLGKYLSSIRSDEAKIIERIIGRDLECGASSTMANKVWKNLIPQQPQMLATAFSEKALAKIKFPAFAQLKADGARAFAEIRGTNLDDVKLFSRAGNEYTNLNALKQSLINAYEKVVEKYPEGITIDGELVYVEPPQQLSALDILMGGGEPSIGDTIANRQKSNGFANKSLKNTITDDEANCMSFQVWDVYSLDTAYADKKSDKYVDRFAELNAIVSDSKRLILIESQIVNSIEEARVIYKNYVLQGLEGIILKNMESLWENKRSANQIKFKEEITIDLRIVGFVPHTKEEFKIGSFILESDCKRIKVKSGSGLTDTDAIKTDAIDEFGEAIWEPIPLSERSELNRAKLFAMWEQIDKTIVEIKCNGFTTDEKRKDSVSLFLPIIMKLRGDKDTTNTFAEMFPDATITFED